MGPKKRKTAAGSSNSRKKRAKGLLGQFAGYNSESDEDYEVPSSTRKPRSPAQAQGRSRKPSKPVDSNSSSSVSPDSDEASDCSYNSASSDSNETLAARQQRRAQQAQPPSTAQQAAAGKAKRAKAVSTKRSAARRAVAAAPAAISRWDQLPTAVLAQIFQGVCKHGALPMAPRLACVCTSWNTAVAATPELWHILDTAKIPKRSWSQPGTHSHDGGSSSGQSKASKGRSKASQAPRRLDASTGLASWVASGRLQQLQALLLYGEGGTAAAAAAAAAAPVPDVNRQLSAQLLMQIADSCPHLHSISLSGAFSLRPEEVSSALLSMPALSKLCLSGVRFSSLSGLNSCLCSVLEAATSTGHPELKELVVEGCLALNQRLVTALGPPAVRHSSGPEGGDLQAAQQEQQQQHPAAMPAVGSPPRPPGSAAFSHLEVLDLSRSGRTYRPFKLQLDDMQAAMPRLRVLQLSGLGELYGWLVSIRDPASLPGFPALEALHVDCAMTAPLSGSMKLLPGTSYVNDAVLLQLAGKSCHLEMLDLSGTHVTPAGLRQLAAALAAQRPTPALAAPAGAAAAAGPQGAATVHEAATVSGSSAAALGGGDDALEVAEDVAAAPAAALLPGAEAPLRVKHLRLDGSRLACNEGLIAVGQCCCDTLEQLVVRGAGSRLGDDGIRGLRGCSKLSILDITGCSVTEAGLSDLLSALPAGVLEELHLDSCRSVSRNARQAAMQGVAQLQQYLAHA